MVGWLGGVLNEETVAGKCGVSPVPALASEREDISVFPDLKKDPFSRIFRLKITPISMKALTFWVRK